MLKKLMKKMSGVPVQAVLAVAAWAAWQMRSRPSVQKRLSFFARRSSESRHR